MSNQRIFETKRDGFLLKAASIGAGNIALVIGSHKYYPRTFSEKLKSHLQLVCADTRGFVPDHIAFVESDFTLTKIIQDIEAIRASFGANKVIVIGHSIHAFMALEYARLFPDKVSHLVLIASSPFVGPELYQRADRYFDESVCPQRKYAFATTMQKFMEKADQSFIERMHAFGPRLWYDETYDASGLWADVTVNALGAGIIWGSMFNDYDITQTLKALKCPIFLALWRYDYFNPPHLWEDYRHLPSDLTIRIFEKSGHTPQLEESDCFDGEVMEWLNQK